MKDAWIFITLMIVALFIGALILLGDDYTSTEARLREAATCEQVLDALGDVHRDAGLAELGRIRYQELRCGDR